jgi:hypothetical protein
MRLSGWRITALVFVIVTALTAAVFLWMGFTEPAVRVLVRDTARISVVLFTLAFAASSLHTLLRQDWTNWLLKNRRYIGVSFAVSHTAHLLTLAVLFVWFPHPFVEESLMRVAVIGGVLAYVFIALMTLTSFDRTAAMIGPRAWRLLHTIGSYYIWVIFAQSYIPRAIRDPWYVPLAILVLLGIGLRAAAWLAKRARKSATKISTA